MNGIIIYKSKYGATKKYAEWLSEATGFLCVSTKEADLSKVAECDVVIVGGGIYASGIACTSCPPPVSLPNPGMEPRSPALQADSLPSEPPGKPIRSEERRVGKEC